MKIVDCITFFEGLDVLEIRLNTLAPYVDRFVICESPYTMVGTKKPLCFGDNKERFKDFNITHLVVHDHEEHMGGDIWAPFFYQIDYIMRGLEDEDSETIILLSDFDEIPDLENYVEGTEGKFYQKLYYYYLNVFTGKDNWRGTVAIKKKNIKNLGYVRHKRSAYKAAGTGWHFSYVSTEEEIIRKIEAFCHQEYNTEAIKRGVFEKRKNLIDPFNRGRRRYSVEMPTGPPWLLANKDRYEHLFYKGE